jgi:hypothetical protein
MKHLNTLLIAIALIIAAPFQSNAQEVNTECYNSERLSSYTYPVTPVQQVFVNISKATDGGYYIPNSNGGIIIEATPKEYDMARVIITKPKESWYKGIMYERTDDRDDGSRVTGRALLACAKDDITTGSNYLSYLDGSNVGDIYLVEAKFAGQYTIAYEIINVGEFHDGYDWTFRYIE